MKRVNDKMLIIDGERFKSLLESKTGKTLKELSLENGYSDSFLRMVVKTGKASPSAVTLAKLYGIEPSEYEVKPADTSVDDTEGKQLTFDDLGAINRSELKALIKEALIEVVNAQEFRACFDPHRQIFEIYSRVEEV